MFPFHQKIVFVPTRQCLRHETELDKRFHSGVENRIVKRVDVLKVIDGLPVGVFGVDAHLVLQQSVKANVFEATLAMNQSQIPLPVAAKTFSGSSCADNFAKESVVWSFGFGEVGGDDGRVGVCALIQMDLLAVRWREESVDKGVT